MAGVLPDILWPGLRVVFCGTAAGAVSARAGWARLRSMTPSSGGQPLDPEGAKVQARVLEHVLRDHAVRAPMKVKTLIAELGGTDDIEAALVQLVGYGLMEVVPDEKVQPTGVAIRFWELMSYLK